MLAHFRRALVKDSRAGIAADGGRIGVARIRRSAEGRPALAACALPGGDADLRREVESRMPGLDLRASAIHLVLDDDRYQLLMVETPNVPEEEKAQAVRWRVKDLIDFPVEEAVVEVFDMPRHANAAAKSMSHAAVTRRSTIGEVSERMRRDGLALDVIDIPELCLRNVATRLPADEFGVAFLHFTEECGHLSITRQGTLYLTRRIEIGREAFSGLPDADAMVEQGETIALQVQRSLDYYESHFDARPIGELVFGPGAGIEALAAAVRPNLELTVSVLDLDQVVMLEHELSAEEAGVCLVAIGAALRNEAGAQAVAA